MIVGRERIGLKRLRTVTTHAAIAVSEISDFYLSQSGRFWKKIFPLKLNMFSISWIKNSARYYIGKKNWRNYFFFVDIVVLPQKNCNEISIFSSAKLSSVNENLRGVVLLYSISGYEMWNSVFSVESASSKKFNPSSPKFKKRTWIDLLF